ncbi:MAG: flavodoxin family protein [Planctomycetes bacterium]|nr:flavodoxin family protein [Planctomycetota bacterium]
MNKAKILVAYFSKSGNTEAMAQKVAEGAQAAGGEVDLMRIKELSAAALTKYDGIIIGTPTYYGLPAAGIKNLFDESVQIHRRLVGKVGGAFATAANIGGGNETAVLAILQAMLIHGMIVPGAAQGDHYGPIGINKPDERALKQAHALGERIATLAAKVMA